MAVQLKSGAIFVHVPKTGGTWVTGVLQDQDLIRGMVGSKHALPTELNSIVRPPTIREVKHQVGGEASWLARREPFRFVFVRNPITWYESWWRFMAGDWHPWEEGRWHPQRPIDDCGNDDFAIFIANVLTRVPGYLTKLYDSYTSQVPFIGRYENLADDLIRALHISGDHVDESLLRNAPPQNVSASRLGSPIWRIDLLTQLIVAEQEAIDRFGYRSELDELCQKRVGKSLRSLISTGL